MYLKLILSVMLALSGILTANATTNTSLAISEIQPKPIPPGYNFPTDQATIEKWIATSDTTAMRRHAWDVLAGMTTDSGEMYEGKPLPIWETWFGSNDIFPAPVDNDPAAITTVNLLVSHRKILHAFIQPRQFTHLKLGVKLSQALGPPEARLLSFDKFNPQAAAFIVAPHAGPNGQIYNYNTSDGLHDLNKAWPTETRGADRSIQSFPNDSIELKPIFNIVKATGLTPIPLWQGPEASTKPESPSPDTWTTCVLVDPKGANRPIRPATPLEIARANKGSELACKKYLYAPLSMLYYFKVSNTEAAAFNKVRGDGVTSQDYAVLLALHIATREAPFWTWQTFYWQPGADTPNSFPGSKANQPANIKTPWKNYAVCTIYSQTTTPGGSEMNVCFNPYVELGILIPNGLSSNCMTCHGTARVVMSNDGTPPPTEYKAPIEFFSDPVYFNSASTNTGFSWALAVNAFR